MQRENVRRKVGRRRSRSSGREKGFVRAGKATSRQRKREHDLPAAVMRDVTDRIRIRERALARPPGPPPLSEAPTISVASSTRTRTSMKTRRSIPPKHSRFGISDPFAFDVTQQRQRDEFQQRSREYTGPRAPPPPPAARSEGSSTRSFADIRSMADVTAGAVEKAFQDRHPKFFGGSLPTNPFEVSSSNYASQIESGNEPEPTQEERKRTRGIHNIQPAMARAIRPVTEARAEPSMLGRIPRVLNQEEYNRSQMNKIHSAGQTGTSMLFNVGKKAVAILGEGLSRAVKEPEERRITIPKPASPEIERISGYKDPFASPPSTPLVTKGMRMIGKAAFGTAKVAGQAIKGLFEGAVSGAIGTARAASKPMMLGMSKEQEEKFRAPEHPAITRLKGEDTRAIPMPEAKSSTISKLSKESPKKPEPKVKPKKKKQEQKVKPKKKKPEVVIPPKKRPKRRAAHAAKIHMIQKQEELDVADDRLDAAEEKVEKAKQQKMKKDLVKSEKTLADKMKKKRKKSPQHLAMIRFLQKRNLPTGGSPNSLKQRIRNYKKNNKNWKKVPSVKTV